MELGPKQTNRLKGQSGLKEGDKELRAGVGTRADLIYDESGTGERQAALKVLGKLANKMEKDEARLPPSSWGRKESDTTQRLNNSQLTTAS